jgi:amino acid permease
MLNPQRVQYISNPDKLVITPTLQKDLIKGWTSNMVKQIKETFSSQWAAPILLTIVLGYNIYDSQKTSSAMSAQAIQMQEQHDLLIKLQTQKEEQEKQHERDRQDAIREADLQRVWRESMTNKMNNLEFVVKNVKG